MRAELRQVANGFAYRVRSFSGYDVNGYRFHTTSHEQQCIKGLMQLRGPGRDLGVDPRVKGRVEAR